MNYVILGFLGWDQEGGEGDEGDGGEAHQQGHEGHRAVAVAGLDASEPRHHPEVTVVGV